MKDGTNGFDLTETEQAVTESDIAATPAPSPEPTQEDAEQSRGGRFLHAVFEGNDQEIKASLTEMADAVLSRYPMIAERYHVLALLEPHNSIDSADLDGIFGSLRRKNGARDKDVLLILLSRGGSIEPAYQISKVCKEFSKQIFAVAIPRHAKSAATLIALGADEIHIGPLGQLGPIDPQLNGLPALGVAQALRTIGGMAQQYPGSSVMFAAYLRDVLTIEQVGYCDRIADSAVQYAQRLLSSKGSTKDRAEITARKLVHEYKDHSFVIDRGEARDLLGEPPIKKESKELEFAEEIYTLFDNFNNLMNHRNKKIIVAGDWESNVLVLEVKRKK